LRKLKFVLVLTKCAGRRSGEMNRYDSSIPGSAFRRTASAVATRSDDTAFPRQSATESGVALRFPQQSKPVVAAEPRWVIACIRGFPRPAQSKFRHAKIWT